MRGKGEGSVSRSSDGAGWIARIDLPRVNGKRRRRKRRAKTRAEALRLLREMQGELHETGSATNARRTVAEAVDTYLALRRNDELSKGALEDVEWASKIITDKLGPIRLADLTVIDCDRFLDDCANGVGRNRPISRSRLGRIRRCLVRVLANEMRTGRLNRNVADLAVIPK